MTTDINGALVSEMIDADHPAVADFAAAGTGDQRTRAVRLYYAVRDGFRYDPYKVDLSIIGLKASGVIVDGFGWCVPKAILLAAACRAVGIGARVGFGEVRNHLSTARLREAMGTDMLYRHGYTAIHLGGQWIKATPKFNVALCRKPGLHTLEFDGSGEFDDVPHEDLMQVFAQHYARLPRLDNASWDEDVAAEVRAST